MTSRHQWSCRVAWSIPEGKAYPFSNQGTRAQADAGIADTAKSFFEDTKKSAKDLARDDLIEVLTGQSASAVHWLQDKFKLDLSVLGRLGGHSYERTVGRSCLEALSIADSGSAPWWRTIPGNGHNLCPDGSTRGLSQQAA